MAKDRTMVMLAQVDSDGKPKIFRGRVKTIVREKHMAEKIMKNKAAGTWMEVKRGKPIDMGINYPEGNKPGTPAAKPTGPAITDEEIKLLVEEKYEGHGVRELSKIISEESDIRLLEAIAASDPRATVVSAARRRITALQK